MNDDAQRWPRVKALFADALNLPPERRADYLREVSDDDPQLTSEVEALLAAHAEAGSFAEGAAMDALASDPAFAG